MISKVSILAGILASSGLAQTVELRMNENPPGFAPINGLSVTKSGETFTFADTTGANYDNFPIPNMATVAVFNGATQLASFPCAALVNPATSSDAFTNGRCSYNGGPVTSMTVTMNSSAASAFGLGELIVNLSAVTVPAASPATLTCLGILLAGLAVFLQRKQFQTE